VIGRAHTHSQTCCQACVKVCYVCSCFLSFTLVRNALTRTAGIGGAGRGALTRPGSRREIEGPEQRHKQEGHTE
jgi:hypothetical protein